MARVPKGAPLGERGSRLVGVMDLAAGRYPGFLFGLPVGRHLPVFHFHESTAASLDPPLRYLAENGYRTILSDELANFVRDGRQPGPRRVMLCFDDALASLWMVVAPLLKRYGLTAVTYAIPGRIAEAPRLRATIDDDPAIDAASADRAPNPFVSWPELEALAAGGTVEVQSHTQTHVMMFASATPIGVVTPNYAAEAPMNRPVLGPDGSLEILTPDRLGFPLFGCRSRMSDGRRFYPDSDACARVETFVTGRGGAAFFAGPGWEAELQPALDAITGRFEDERHQAAAIERELIVSRETLSARLHRSIRHVCLPWGVAGAVTRTTLERLGFLTAFANRWTGRLAVAAGDDPFFLKRLHSRHIFALPGRGRRVFTTFA